MNADVEAEVVYVGAGRKRITPARTSPARSCWIRVGKFRFQRRRQSAGCRRRPRERVAGVSGNAAGYSLDQIGWASVSPRPERGGFGFALSLRQFLELRGYLERGEKVVVRPMSGRKHIPRE